MAEFIAPGGWLYLRAQQRHTHNNNNNNENGVRGDAIVGWWTMASGCACACKTPPHNSVMGWWAKQ